jgi:hypothetical protein
LISRQQAAFLACAASSCPNSSAVVFFGRSMGVSVASMLMPEGFLQKDLSDFILDIDDAEQIQSLAKRYEVSTQAMTLRLVNLLSRRRL